MKSVISILLRVVEFKLIVAFIGLALMVGKAQAQSYKKCTVNNKKYDCVLNIKYGEHDLQAYDLYLPNNRSANSPVPLVVYIHGGGYYQGDKSSGINSHVPAKKYLDAGMAWATINYRLSGEFPFRKSSKMPYPVQMADGALALQKLRSTAKYHGFDKNRVALAGSSAGGGISMWVALHDDLAQPNSSNFVLRQSTKVPCLGLVATQTTLNIPEVEELMTGTKYALDEGLSGLYGLTPKKYAKNPSYWDKVLRESYLAASPITHLDASDKVKVVLVYTMGYGTGDIHGAEFGDYLTQGEPMKLANDYNRNSLDQFNIDYDMYTSVTVKKDSQNLTFNALKKCLTN